MKKRFFSIGELSKATACPIETIRYYGKIALLQDFERTEGNQRRYSEVEYDRLLFILHARNLGFSIDAIRQLLILANHPKEPCEQADAIAKAQLTETRVRIKRLKLLEKELLKMTKHCQHHTIEQCSVIESLAHCNYKHCNDKHCNENHQTRHYQK